MGWLLNFAIKNTVNSAEKWMDGLQGVAASDALMDWVKTRKKSDEISSFLADRASYYKESSGSPMHKFFY